MEEEIIENENEVEIKKSHSTLKDVLKYIVPIYSTFILILIVGLLVVGGKYHTSTSTGLSALAGLDKIPDLFIADLIITGLISLILIIFNIIKNFNNKEATNNLKICLNIIITYYLFNTIIIISNISRIFYITSTKNSYATDNLILTLYTIFRYLLAPFFIIPVLKLLNRNEKSSKKTILIFVFLVLIRIILGIITNTVHGNFKLEYTANIFILSELAELIFIVPCYLCGLISNNKNGDIEHTKIGSKTILLLLIVIIAGIIIGRISNNLYSTYTTFDNSSTFTTD